MGSFVRQEQRFAEAALSVIETADEITDVKALRRWNGFVVVQLTEMKMAREQIVKIRRASSEEAARIAGEAATITAQVIELVAVYGDEVNQGALTPAASATDAIHTLLRQLDAQAKAWKKL